MDGRGRSSDRVSWAALLVAALLATGCGGEGAPSSPRLRDGVYVAQEIYLSYFSPAHADRGRRIHRTPEEARALAQDLRERVEGGEDIGRLAQEFSNAPGGAALGFSAFLRPEALAPDDPRPGALDAVPVGGLTPVLPWEGGYWFARRVSMERGRELQRLFERVGRERAKFRAIALLYRGAWVADAEAREQIVRTKDETIAYARELLQRIQAGEAFEAVAREASQDPFSKERGGLVTLPDPARPGERTPWIRRQEPGVPEEVLRVIFEDEPGVVHPDVIVSPRGVFVVKTEARRELLPPEGER